MSSTKQIENIYAVVEGPSEAKYFTTLSRFCGENDIKISFKVEPAFGSSVKKIKVALKKLGRKAKNKDIFIFLDYDKFKREEAFLIDYKTLNRHIFFFEYCFEDFLIRHLPEESYIRWRAICEKVGHYNDPMKNHTLVQEIQAIFNKYKKGRLPEELSTITEMHISNLKKRKDSFKENGIKKVSLFILGPLVLNRI